METPATLSIVIPVFNEEKRLPLRLPHYIDYLEAHLPSYEIVVVDDGSTDGTWAVVEALEAANPKIRGIRSVVNRGRGFGMREGVLAAKGDFILETDADLPVSPSHVPRFLEELRSNPRLDILIGSRGLRGSTFVLDQPWARVFAGKGFHALFGYLFDIHYRDVMCGFKMMRHRPGKEIFSRVYDERFLAAGEVVHAARVLGYGMKELPVEWEDNRDSKVRIVRDSLRTLKGLGQMLVRDFLGMYGPYMNIAYRDARRAIVRSAPQGWPGIFTRIRLYFTAPYPALASVVPREGFIIDLGSGYGIFSNLLGLISPARKVLGLELDAYKAKHAKALVSNVSFRQADITKIDVPPADCVMLIHVLHHLNSYADQETLLAACYSKLRKGGTLLVCEIEPRPWFKFFLTRIADAMLYPGDTIYYRFRPELEPILKRLGGAVRVIPMQPGTPFSHVSYVVIKA
ncbi:MAG: glycosyltransferase [Patescibacteria group bacterium]